MVDAATAAFYAQYKPTLEDRLAIQEYFDECWAVAKQQARARAIEETSTVSHRIPSCLRWDAPGSPLLAAVEGVLS